MGWGKINKIIIFCCSIFLLLILSAPDVDTNISNSNNKYLDCDPKSYAEVDFLRVNNIQTFLKNENLLDGKVSGYFDENLLIGLKKFQQFVGIRIDGIMGPSTHKAMTNYDKCEKKVRASMIDCGEYLAYKECTFFVNLLSKSLTIKSNLFLNKLLASLLPTLPKPIKPIFIFSSFLTFYYFIFWIMKWSSL